MKFSIFSFLMLSILVFSSCGKSDTLKEKTKVKDDKYGDKEDRVCTWDGSKVADTNIWTEYIVEPLVMDEECGCIVSGFVKYVEKNDKLIYLIYYGKGECDNWAYLVTCYDGDCEGDKTEKCKFELACTPKDGN